MLSATLVLSVIFACSESKNSTKNENVSTVEQTEETAPEQAAAPDTKEKDFNASSRVTSQFDQLGLELSGEQEQQIQDIASRYDFEGAADRDARKAMRQEFQKEIFEKVLTPEQRDTYNQKRDANKRGR